MGEANRRRKRSELFLRKHPLCAYCGGGSAATTVDHCPPRSMFHNREWPEGLEFPACSSCNQGTSDLDAFIAWLARMDPFDSSGRLDEQTIGLMNRVSRAFPGLLQKMLPSVVEARKANKRFGISPALGQSHSETGAVKVPREISELVGQFSKKFFKAAYYMEEGCTPFPNAGAVVFQWASNTDLFEYGSYKLLDAMKELPGKVPELVRTGRDLKDQFQFKISTSEEPNLVIVQTIFGRAFAAVAIGSNQSGDLRLVMNRMATRRGKPPPFEVVQSGA